MKFALDILTSVYRKLQRRAATEHLTVSELILRGLEQVVKEWQQERGPRVKLPLVPSKEPGTLYLDNAKIYKIISFP